MSDVLWPKASSCTISQFHSKFDGQSESTHMHLAITQVMCWFNVCSSSRVYVGLSSPTTTYNLQCSVCRYSPVSRPPTPRSALLAAVLMTALVHCLHIYEICTATKVCCVGGS